MTTMKRLRRFNKLPVLRLCALSGLSAKHLLRVKNGWTFYVRHKILINEFIILCWHWRKKEHIANNWIKWKKKEMRHHKVRSSVNSLLIRIRIASARNYWVLDCAHSQSKDVDNSWHMKIRNKNRKQSQMSANNAISLFSNVSDFLSFYFILFHSHVNISNHFDCAIVMIHNRSAVFSPPIHSLLLLLLKEKVTSLSWLL